MFAFGAVYPWASRPAAAVTGLLFLFARPSIFRDRTWVLDSALTLLVIYGWLQFVPLPGSLVAALSPASVAFHQALNLAPYDPAAWRPISLAPSASLDALINFTAAVLFYWTVRESSGQAGTRVLARSLAVMGAIAVLLAVLQPLLFPNGKVYGFWSPIYKEAHPVGPIISRNHFASWMVLAAPITAGYLLTHAQTYWVGSTRLRMSVRALSDTRALWVGTCVALMVTGVIFSQSRAGLIGLSVATVYALASSWQRFGNWGRAGLIAVATLLCLAAWMVANPADVMRRLESTARDDWGGRPAIWSATRSMAVQYPLTGIGLGAYEGAMPVYQPEPRLVLFNHAHSQYMQWWAEGGLIGIVLAGAIAIAGIRLVERRRRRDRSSLVHLRDGAVAGIVGLAVQSFWETPLVTPGVLWLLAVAAAIATERPPVSDSARGESR